MNESLINTTINADDEKLIKHIDNFIHTLAAKNGRKKFNEKQRDNTMKDFFSSVEYLAKKGLIHDREKFYPCISERIKVNSLNEKYFFLERIININNRNKAILTEGLMKIFSLYADQYFEEFLKLAISTYNRKETFSASDLYSMTRKYIVYFSDMIGKDQEELDKLCKKGNLIKLYNLISKAGIIYQANNSILCFKSLFYNRESFINEEEFNNSAILDGKKVRVNLSLEEFELSELAIVSLINSNYLNRKTIDTEIKSLLERDFYIPKKKRRKRIYTEDKQYLVSSNKKIPNDSIIYSYGKYNVGDRKIKRDKNSFKKRYIPEIRNERIKEIFIKNELKDRELYCYAQQLIMNSK